MIWRIIILFGILLGAMAGTLLATRNTEIPLTSSLLVLRDNRLYRVSMAGNRILLFAADDGEIISHMRLSRDNTTAFVVVHDDTQTSLYRVDYNRPGQIQQLFSEDRTYRFSYSPDEQFIAYTVLRSNRHDLVVRHISGKQFRSFQLDTGSYSVIWKDNHTLTVRIENLQEQLLVDVQANSIQKAPFEPEIVDYTMSPDGQWDIISETPSNEPDSTDARYYLLHRFTQQKIYIPELPKSTRLDVVWSRDSQWVALFADPAGRNIYTYQITSRSVGKLSQDEGYFHTTNYFYNGYADVSPTWANGSYHNEWLLYSFITHPFHNPESRTTFNVIHRDGKAHFRNIIGIRSGPDTPFWAQWLPPEQSREIGLQFLLTVMSATVIASIRIRRLRLKGAI